MKTISIALVSAGLLALTACGGGGKGNTTTNAANGTATTTGAGTDLNTTTVPPLDANAVAANTTGPVPTNTLGTNAAASPGNALGNAADGNGALLNATIK